MSRSITVSEFSGLCDAPHKSGSHLTIPAPLGVYSASSTFARPASNDLAGSFFKGHYPSEPIFHGFSGPDQLQHLYHHLLYPAASRMFRRPRSAPPIERVVTVNRRPVPPPQSYETHSEAGVRALLRGRGLNAEGDLQTLRQRLYDDDRAQQAFDTGPVSGSRSPHQVSCAGPLCVEPCL